MPKNKEKKSFLGNGNGDNLWFFILYNIYSLIVFFIFGYSANLFVSITMISQIFSVEFLNVYLNILFWNIISSIFGWFLALFTLRAFKTYVLKKAMKNFHDLNVGLNKFPITSLAFYISIFISTFCFTIGASTIIENLLFSELSIITLMISFLLIKIVIYGITKMIIESRF